MATVYLEHSRPQLFHIPTEVCENIIDMLYTEYDTTSRQREIITLHSCALVCRDWRVRAQRMLFYQVQLVNTISFCRFSNTLEDGPHLRDYVYKVQLTGYHLHNTTSIFALFPAVFAGKLPNLCQIEAVHLSDTEETRFPRTPGSPKVKALPYIPLHPRFQTFLSAFTAVSELYLEETTFSTFSDFARMLHGLPNLFDLACYSIHWIAPGGSHPGFDFTRQPQWVAGKGTLPPFAPKLRELELYNIAMYGAKRLIWTRGPHLTWLSLAIPLSTDPEGLADCQGLDLGSCTGLRSLDLVITSEFSVDTHGGFITELLASWKPQTLDPLLRLTPYREAEDTRQRFAEILRGIGTITEAWLQTLDDQPPSGHIGDHHQLVKCQVNVALRDWEAKRKWWLDLLESCFPAWVKLGRLKLILYTPQVVNDEWDNEVEPTQLGAIAVS